MTFQRGLPPVRRAASSLVFIPPPTTAECRGEPLPGVPVTAHREAPLSGGAIRVEPWSGFRLMIDRRFIPCMRSAG